jgi:DNA repair ATPase RecN
VAYSGDPDSPHLTEDERCKIKRRAANRESARRVRQKKDIQVQEMDCKLQDACQHVGRLQHETADLSEQLLAVQEKLRQAHAQILKLHTHLSNLMQQPRRVLVSPQQVVSTHAEQQQPLPPLQQLQQHVQPMNTYMEDTLSLGETYVLWDMASNYSDFMA